RAVATGNRPPVRGPAGPGAPPPATREVATPGVRRGTGAARLAVGAKTALARIAAGAQATVTRSTVGPPVAPILRRAAALARRASGAVLSQAGGGCVVARERRISRAAGTADPVVARCTRRAARWRAARKPGVDWPPHRLIEARCLGRRGARPGVARLAFPARIARGAAEIVLRRTAQVALRRTAQVLVVVELVEVVVVVDVDVHVTVDVHVVVGVAIPRWSHVTGRGPECRTVDRVVHIGWR